MKSKRSRWRRINVRLTRWATTALAVAALPTGALAIDAPQTRDTVHVTVREQAAVAAPARAVARLGGGVGWQVTSLPAPR